MNWWNRLQFFDPDEFVCKCGKCDGSTPEGVAELMDKDFVQRLDALRLRVGAQAAITSGYRCPDHNDKVSRTGRTGPHTTGRAADIAWNRAVAYESLGYLKELGLTGIGVNQKGNGRFMHFDDLPDAPGQPRPTLFSY